MKKREQKRDSKRAKEGVRELKSELSVCVCMREREREREKKKKKKLKKWLWRKYEKVISGRRLWFLQPIAFNFFNFQQSFFELTIKFLGCLN